MIVNNISSKNIKINQRTFTKSKNSKKNVKIQNKNFTSFYYDKNFYLNNISFKRKLKNAKDAHLDYLGANINKNNTATFRVYSTKEEIELQIAQNKHDIPYWKEADSKEEAKAGIISYKMKKIKDGNIFEITPDIKITKDTTYRYKIKDKEGKITYAKDPRSYYQPKGAMGWSGIYNHDNYEWHDESWQKGLDKRKLKHIKDECLWGAPPETVISEKHIGILGGYNNAKKEIDEIANQGICNTIYLLPLGGFFGEFNRGYDEVDKFAPNSSYGTPDELKSLVDYAHQKGINVILDVVPNHFGFIGASEEQFAPSTDNQRQTGWGAALNFDKKNGVYMRNYMSDMMINWLVNYHFDGLRIDATEKLNSDASLKYFAAEIRNHKETQDAILIPEHIDKTRKLAQPLYEKEINYPLNTFICAKKANLKADRLGYDVQYIYDFKNTLSALLLNMQIYDCPPNIDDLAIEYMQGNRFYDKESSNLENLKANNCFVYFNMHDESDVYAGVRFVVRALAKELNLADDNILTSPDSLDKKGYLEAENMLEDYLNNNFENCKNKQEITKEEFEKCYKTAKAKNRLMIASVFMHPGIKGFSMGDEVGQLTPFRYFAQYDNPEIAKKVSKEKGYDIGYEAFKKSSKLYNPIQDTNFINQTTRLSKDFTELISQNNALKYGDFNKTIANAIDSESIFIHRWDQKGNDIFAIANFSPNKKKFEQIKNFPNGKWMEILNTDDEKYGGSGINNKNKIIKQGDEITLAPYCISVFKAI